MNSGSLFSAQWHRVRDVRPRLANDVAVSRHVYRGRPTYVLQRRATNAFHQLDTSSFELIDQLDGEVSVGELWERVIVERDQGAPTQDEWIDLLAQLHAAELLVVNRRVPEERLFEKRKDNQASERRARYLNPLFLRFALHDPEPWLNKLKPLSARLFSRTAGIIWLLLMLSGAYQILLHSEQLARAVTDREFLSGRHALLFFLLYPAMKLVHELAHALAIKRCGGEVHETGISLMVLLPLPYVDASASAMFPNKYDRMLVSSAGIIVELACAAIGALLWANAAGTLHEIGLVMMVVGGLSTLLLNGNPLLKFDGYYLLSDWIEIPNLAARSRRAVLDSLRSLVSGVNSVGVLVEDRMERIWLHAYGVCSALYRTVLMLWIAWMLSEQWFFLGVLLAAFAVFLTICVPLKRVLAVLTKDPVYRSRRSLVATGVLPLLLLAMVFWLPLPHSSVETGVIWIPDDAVIRVSSDCDVSRVHVSPGTVVETGDTLFICEEPIASAREKVLVARVDELETRRAAEVARDPLALDAVDAELNASRAALQDAQVRIASSTVVARIDGVFDVIDTSALPGRRFSRGDLVGYVVPAGLRTVRFAIDERFVTRFDNDLESVALRVNSADGGARVYDTTVLRRTPKATRVVASAALSSFGGGQFAADENGDGRLLKEAVFDVELVWPDVERSAAVGSHVGVRLVYSPTTLSDRLSTTLRQAIAGRVAS